MTKRYSTDGPTRAAIDAMTGAVVVEFGTDWCGFCQAAQRPIEAALAGFPDVAHVRIEDGEGRPTGRSFRVTQWPTLVFLSNGSEVARVVRPSEADEVGRALATLAAASR